MFLIERMLHIAITRSLHILHYATLFQAQVKQTTPFFKKIHCTQLNKNVIASSRNIVIMQKERKHNSVLVRNCLSCLQT